MKNLKVISKVLNVCSIIARILLIVGGIGIVVAAALSPILLSNISIKNNKIKVFDEVVEYKEVNGDYELYYKNEKVELAKIESDVVELAIDTVKGHEGKELIPFVETAYALALITLVLEFVILAQAGKIFKNISMEKVFDMDNAKRTRVIGILVLVIALINTIFSVIFGILIGANVSISLPIDALLSLVVIFAISYLFEAGMEQQKIAE